VRHLLLGVVVLAPLLLSGCVVSPLVRDELLGQSDDGFIARTQREEVESLSVGLRPHELTLRVRVRDRYGRSWLVRQSRTGDESVGLAPFEPAVVLCDHPAPTVRTIVLESAPPPGLTIGDALRRDEFRGAIFVTLDRREDGWDAWVYLPPDEGRFSAIESQSTPGSFGRDRVIHRFIPTVEGLRKRHRAGGVVAFCAVLPFTVAADVVLGTLSVVQVPALFAGARTGDP
jgi:hypothetical protein